MEGEKEGAEEEGKKLPRLPRLLTEVSVNGIWNSGNADLCAERRREGSFSSNASLESEVISLVP